MAKNILITGGAGFIGNYLTNALINGGYSVTIFDNLDQETHLTSNIPPRINKDAEFVFGDVRNYDALKKAVAGKDLIFHLASKNSVFHSSQDANSYYETNYEGTVNLVNAIKELDETPKIILTSSRAVYGEGKYFCPKGHLAFPASREVSNLDSGKYNPICIEHNEELSDFLPSQENQILTPASVYAKTKLLQEETVKSSGVDYNIFRLSNIYGNGQSVKNKQLYIVSQLINKAHLSEDLVLYENGDVIRDFVHVSDVARILTDSINLPSSENKIINVGTGIPISLQELALAIKKVNNSSSNIILSDKARVGDVKRAVLDPTLMYQTFPIGLTSLEDGLKQS